MGSNRRGKGTHGVFEKAKAKMNRYNDGKLPKRSSFLLLKKEAEL
jgi:hypothetical protein